jgi:hypothetical protein
MVNFYDEKFENPETRARGLKAGRLGLVTWLETQRGDYSWELQAKYLVTETRLANKNPKYFYRQNNRWTVRQKR